MALIKCTECGKEFSDKAEACPNCGCPISEVLSSKNTELPGSKNKDTDNLPNIPDTQDISDIPDTQDISDIPHTQNIPDMPDIPAPEVPKTKNRSLGMLIIGIIAVAAIAVAVFFMTENSREYSKAQKLLADKKYTEAETIFKELGDYKDSSSVVTECEYQLGMKAFERKEYENALQVFVGIKDYKDSSSVAMECKYQLGMKAFKDEEFENALQVFEGIKDYKDSAEMVEKSTYEASVDGQFLRALAKGLTARWVKENENTMGGYEIEDAETNREYCQIELDQIEEFYEMTFDNPDLQADARKYIDYLKDAQAATNHYNMDYSLYYEKWSSIHAERTILLKKMVDEYGLKIDEKYKKKFDSLMNDAAAATETKKLKQSIDDMCKAFEVTVKKDDWGYKTYNIKMKNTTNLTFEYFYVDANIVDEQGNIVTTGSSGQIESWKPGVEANTQFWVEKDDIDINNYSITYTPHYSSGSYYQ